MTREAYLDYWVTWLRRTEPSMKLEVDRGTIVMMRDGVKYSGLPVQCACNDEECLGWAMVTIKESSQRGGSN